MKLIYQEKSFYVGIRDVKSDVKRLTDQFYAFFRDHFSEVIVGKDSYVFINGFFQHFFKYGLIKFISEAQINIVEKTKYSIIHVKLSFIRFACCYTVLCFILLYQFYFEFHWPIVALSAPVIFFFMFVLYLQIVAASFYSQIKRCVRLAGFKIE